MTVDDVVKLVSLLGVPAVGAIVWLLSQVYGLRADLREIQGESRQHIVQLANLTATVGQLSRSVTELTILLAKHGIHQGEKEHT